MKAIDSRSIRRRSSTMPVCSAADVVVVCPQGAKYVRDDTGIVKRMIKSGKKVVASVAPSFLASFDVEGIGGLELALKELGFFAAEETGGGRLYGENRV